MPCQALRYEGESGTRESVKSRIDAMKIAELHVERLGLVVSRVGVSYLVAEVHVKSTTDSTQLWS